MYKRQDDIGGVYISNVVKNSAAEKSGLQKGDVIVKIGKYDIGRRGYYRDDKYGKIFWSHLIRGNSKVGDTIDLTIIRDGKEQTVSALLERANEKLIPSQTYGTAPQYLVKGGFIFQELTQTYLEAFGDSWLSKAPLNLLSIYASQEKHQANKERIVILSATIPTPATTGYDSFRNLVVEKVNGVDIINISSLINAFKQPVENGLHTIEFAEGPPKKVYLDKTASDAVDAELLQRGIPALSREVQ